MIYAHLAFAIAYLAIVALYLFVNWPLLKRRKELQAHPYDTEALVSAALLFLFVVMSILHLFMGGVFYAIWGRYV